MKYRCFSIIIIAALLFSGCSGFEKFRETQKKNQAEKSRIWVSDYTGDVVYQVDTLSGRLNGKISVSGAPTRMAVDPAAKTAYVSCSKSKEVAVISGGRESARITVGETPAGLALNSGGDKLAVVLSDENSVAVVDLKTKSVLGKIPVGNKPFEISEISPGKFAVTNNGGDTVTIIDIDSMKPVQDVRVGVSPYCTALDSAKNLLYTACFSENRLKILDLSGYKITGDIQTGEGPYGVALSKGENIAVVSCNSEGVLSVIDIPSQKELRKITVGSMPCDVEYSPGGEYVIAVCEGDQKLLCLSSADYSTVWELVLSGTPGSLAIERR
ncbi:MAG: YncE family protein [Chloroflexi bacterium]|nr:YncE family protein [Chloroflexota bacterium]